MYVRKMLDPDDFGEAAPAPAPTPVAAAAATGQVTAASSANRRGDTRDVQGTTKTRVRKVYHKERSSRRVAHLPPEFRALGREPRMYKKRPRTYAYKNRQRVYKWRKGIVYTGVVEE
jgi:hypothetical protein